MLGRYILLAGRIAIAVPRVQAGMPFLTFGSGYAVRHSLTAAQLVKPVTFHKGEKCDWVLYKVKYKMVMSVFMGENLLETGLSVSLDLSDLTSGRGGLALCEKWMF